MSNWPRADTLLLNAAECEPLLHKDKELLREFADLVVEGMAIGMRAVGARRGIIGIKEKYGDEIDRLRTKLPRNMEVRPLRNAYPAGDEFILVYDVLRRVIPPGGIPPAVGAVVVNVETAMNMARSADRPVVEKYLTVAGAVAEPVTLCVPLGATLAQCVAAAGGPTIADANYLVGGVMMGYLEENHDALVDKTTGGVIVLPNDHTVVRSPAARLAADRPDRPQRLRPVQFLHRTVPSLVVGASHRTASRHAKPRVQPDRRSKRRRRTVLLRVQFVQPVFLSRGQVDPKNVCVHNKRRLAAERRRWADPPLNSKRPELHAANRKAPMSRLITKLGLRHFRNVGPLCRTPLAVDRVGIKLKQHIGAPLPTDRRRRPAGEKGRSRRPTADGRWSSGPWRSGSRLDRRRCRRRRKRRRMDRTKIENHEQKTASGCNPLAPSP